MNNDQISGKVDQIKGDVKKAVGEAVGNQKLANEGVADHLKGDAKETWGNAKDAVRQNADAAHHDAAVHAENTRDNIVRKADEMKDSVNAKIDEHKHA